MITPKLSVLWQSIVSSVTFLTDNIIAHFLFGHYSNSPKWEPRCLQAWILWLSASGGQLQDLHFDVHQKVLDQLGCVPQVIAWRPKARMAAHASKCQHNLLLHPIPQTRFPAPEAAKQSHSIMLPPCLTLGTVPKQLQFSLIRPKDKLSELIPMFQMVTGKLESGLNVTLCE